MRILIDGFDLQYGKQTGITTYTLGLCNIISECGYDLSVLLSKAYRNRKRFNEDIFIQKIKQYVDCDITENKNVKKSNIKKFLNFISEISTGICESYYHFDKKILSDIFDKYDIPQNILNISNLNYVAFFKLKFFSSLWAINNYHNFDIFHMPSQRPYYMKKCKNIVTIHDIIPLKLPYSTNTNIERYYSLIQKTLKTADKIITISNSSKNDLVNTFHCRDDIIDVIYQASNLYATNHGAELAESNVKELFALSSNKYFLYYGALEPKKNIKRIIEAWRMTKNKLPLVIVGNAGWLNKDILSLIRFLKNSNVKPPLIHLPYLRKDDLYDVIKCATACVFPSLYEGFGLPVLECMQIGCPVITSNTSSLPEVGGDAVIYVDPYSINDISSAMDRVIENNGLRSELIQKGFKQANNFSIKKYTERMKMLYESL